LPSFATLTGQVTRFCPSTAPFCKVSDTPRPSLSSKPSSPAASFYKFPVVKRKTLWLWNHDPVMICCKMPTTTKAKRTHCRRVQCFCDKPSKRTPFLRFYLTIFIRSGCLYINNIFTEYFLHFLNNINPVFRCCDDVEIYPQCF